MGMHDVDSMVSLNDMAPYRETGRQDRLAGSPPSNAPLPMGEVLRLISETKAKLTSQFATWLDSHRRHRENVAGIAHRMSAYKAQSEFAVQAKEKSRQLLQGSGEEWGRSPIKLATTERDEAKAALDMIRAQENGRPVHSHLGPWTYLIVMVALSVLEFPINLEAATAIFPEESDVLTLALAAIVGTLLVGYAHTSGRFIKQKSVLGLARRLSWLVWGAATVMSVGAIAALYFMRWRLMNKLNIEDNGELMFFLFLNASVFFFGLLTSVLHYDSNPQYQSAHTKLQNREAFLHKLERKLQDSKNVIDQDFATLRSTQFHWQEQLKGELAKAEQERQKSLQDWLLALSQGTSLLGAQLTVYAQGNQEADLNAVLPAWLNQTGIDQIVADIYAYFHAEAVKCA